MWKTPGTAVPIDLSQVVVGLYVWLDIPWAEHPFLSSRFMVKTLKDVAIIKATAIEGRLYYYPDESAVLPPPVLKAVVVSAETAAQAAEKAALAQELRELQRLKQEKLQRQQSAAARAEKAWEDAARATRDALVNLARSPRLAGEQLEQLSRQTALTIAQSQAVLLHLLGDKKGKGPQFHALNTMTVCLLVGKAAGLTERELADLALGALAHDAGKAQLPAQILQTSRRKKFEEDFYRQHVRFSVELAEKSGAFSREALAVIANHHEAADGSGWPDGKTEASKGARILALVDRFDRLCTPEAIDVEPMMPAEALAHMYRYEAGRFDPALLGLLIKLLGVYPPGTVVKLSDGSLALVVAPGPLSLLPRVLIYSPEVPKDEAPALDLATEPELKIIEAIRPSSLPPDVMQWLSPQKRLSYYFAVTDVAG